MKISIVVPIFNVKQYIRDGIQQLLALELEDTEIILVDDGSTDGSDLIIEELAASNEKICALHQTNSGAGPARNYGFQYAAGEYIWFYDIDDKIEPSLLTTCRTAIEKNGFPDMLCFGYDTWDQKYKQSSTCRFPFLNLRSNQEVRSHYVDVLMGLNFPNGFVWNKIYKKSFLVENKIEFPRLKIQQDEVFNLSCYKKVSHLICIPDVLYHYFIYYQGNTRSYYIKDRIGILNQVKSAFLDLYKYWQLNDLRMQSYIYQRHLRHIIDSIHYNLSRGLSTNKDLFNIFSSPQIIDSIENIRKLEYKGVSCRRLLYIRAMYLKSPVLYRFLFRFNSYIDKIKGVLRLLTKFKN